MKYHDLFYFYLELCLLLLVVFCPRRRCIEQPPGVEKDVQEGIRELSMTIGELSVATTNVGVVVESPHPYDTDTTYYSSNILIGSSGSMTYVLQFDGQTETEGGYDFVMVYVGDKTGAVLYSNSGTGFPSSITVASSTGIVFELSSDSSLTAWGLKCTVVILDPTLMPTPMPTPMPTTLAPITLYPTLASVVCNRFDVVGYNNTICPFTVCPLSTANATCSYSNDPPSLTLFSSNGSQVAGVYHYNSTVTRVVGIVYTKSTGPCEQYFLHQVCGAGERCSGWTLVAGASYLAPTRQPSGAPTLQPSAVYLNVAVNVLTDGAVNVSACYPPTPHGSCNLRSAWTACSTYADPHYSSLFLDRSCTITLPAKQVLTFNAALGPLLISHNFDTHILIHGRGAVVADINNFNGRFINSTRLASGSTQNISLYNFTLSKFGGSSVNGGAIYMSGVSRGLLSGMIFDSNRGLTGGSVYGVGGRYGPSSLVIDKCQFIGTTADSNGGAGALCETVPLLNSCVLVHSHLLPLRSTSSHSPLILRSYSFHYSLSPHPHFTLPLLLLHQYPLPFN